MGERRLVRASKPVKAVYLYPSPSFILDGSRKMSEIVWGQKSNHASISSILGLTLQLEALLNAIKSPS
jgi:hypothetical protein